MIQILPRNKASVALHATISTNSAGLLTSGRTAARARLSLVALPETFESADDIPSIPPSTSGQLHGH